ncbi:hypothetical protein [Bifidobacterium scaligerum]|uniref:Uncharacterized protein n=1 Tax=Bifidobacterium scaligerum TaxID=2052656 RepID=A0A2M9HT45_9BIFI|nr:hypothetical protein [Bifidobacterium scaligerum]PJM79980.1 hypothetical protein CUU80_02265 [Bifidobacterium scaligerum]
MSATESALPPLMSIQDMMEHTGKSYSLVSKWSSGARECPYGPPVRNGKFIMGWRPEVVAAVDERNTYSIADYLYGKAGK